MERALLEWLPSQVARGDGDGIHDILPDDAETEDGSSRSGASEGQESKKGCDCRGKPDTADGGSSVGIDFVEVLREDQRPVA